MSQTRWWRFGEAPIKEVQAIRAAEESLMARLIGARLRSLELPEALLRGYRYEQIATAQPGEQDAEVTRAVTAAAANAADQYPRAHWRLPLGVGNHIDHRLTRDAALAGLRAAGVEENRIGFYEDLPYAATLPKSPEFGDTPAGRTLKSSSFKIQIRWKRELLRLYWSQINWSQIVEVGEYAARIGGGRAMERVWLYD
jgi:LmbE family N-acetylglucosaminyl deacetylase